MTDAKALVELKPCPFCGEQPHVTDDDSYGGCIIGCYCVTEPFVKMAIADKDKAIEAWNTRAAAHIEASQGGEDADYDERIKQLEAITQSGSMMSGHEVLEIRRAITTLKVAKARAALASRPNEPSERDAGFRAGIEAAAKKVDQVVSIGEASPYWKRSDVQNIRDIATAIRAITPPKYQWQGEGPEPPSWYHVDGTKVYRSYEGYCDD